MNFLGTNNQETVIFKHSSNDQVKFLPPPPPPPPPPQPVFHLRYSYYQWFNGMNSENYNSFNKLTNSNWPNAFGVNNGISQIVLSVLSVKVDGVVVFTGPEEIFAATNNLAYEFEDDGYGVGCISYISQLNSFISDYGLQTLFYPAGGNRIAGIINTSENFEVSLREVATHSPSTYTLQDDYSIKCENGVVSDAVNGYFITWSTF